MRTWKITAMVAVMCVVALVGVAAFTGFQSIRLSGGSDTYRIDSRNSSDSTTFSVTPAGAVALTSVSGTGVVSSTNIADITRTIYFDIGAAAIDGGNDVDDGSAPSLTTLDNVPAILWDTSAENAAVQWTFPVPADYSTGMVFYALVSSDDADSTGQAVDWALTKNTSSGAFGSPTAQAEVDLTSTSLDTTCELVTFTPDSTGAALFVDGAVVTVEVFNAASTTSDDDLELKVFWGEYIATQ